MKSASFSELITPLANAETVEELQTVFAEFCAWGKFDHFIYGAQIYRPESDPFLFVLNGYPKEWFRRYLAQDYLKIDPTVSHCRKEVSPICWDTLAPLEKKDASIGNFMNEARDFGLRSGCSFPVYTFRGDAAILSLASRQAPHRARRQILDILPYAQLFACYLHEAASRIIEGNNLRLSSENLTSRESECLFPA